MIRTGLLINVTAKLYNCRRRRHCCQRGVDWHRDGHSFRAWYGILTIVSRATAAWLEAPPLIQSLWMYFVLFMFNLWQRH